MDLSPVPGCSWCEPGRRRDGDLVWRVAAGAQVGAGLGGAKGNP